MRGLFIIGTGTDVGKTYVTQLIARELCASGVRCGIYKPVCSGAETGPDGSPRWSDVEIHFAALAGKFPREKICPQAFLAPAAPSVAAREEGKSVNSRLLRQGLVEWESEADLLLVEGAGGLLAPLSDSESIVDLIVESGYPAVLVCTPALGSINVTLLTLEVAKLRGVRVAGLIVNEANPPQFSVAERTSAAEIARRTAVPILATVKWKQSEWLRASETGRTIDWSAIAEG